ncbi:MAG: sigma 54-interacting transcriptional regulator [Desulfosarcina sp.]|nr:sigma 54-interacting transcriptional regulator [Desulfosarcina sp.]MBC2741719.1 sigma 54-interacting transcriptional regulator [Desulfosarcina sp.]MBC2764633.1 sigma-54 factor interaction domain-containing protein [Desulfosarcina sp.]
MPEKSDIEALKTTVAKLKRKISGLKRLNATLTAEKKILDEIGELPLELQKKLLRVLQEGEFERLGSSLVRRTNVRVTVATNRNLEASVGKGRFRKDLWYRLFLSCFPYTGERCSKYHWPNLTGNYRFVIVPLQGGCIPAATDGFV